MDENGMILTRS